MGKMIAYLAVMSGFMLVFYFMGLLPENTTTSSLMLLLLSPTTIFTSSGLYAAVRVFINIIAALIISAFGRNFIPNVDMVYLAPITIILLGFGGDFIKVVSVLLANNEVLTILLISPFLMIYIIAVIEWFRGRD